MKYAKGRDDKKWKKSSKNKHVFNEKKTISNEEMPKSILKKTKNKNFGSPIKNKNFVENNDQQINEDFTSNEQSVEEHEQMTSAIKKNKNKHNKKFQKLKKEVDEETEQNESMEIENSVVKSAKRKSDDFEDSANKKIKPCEMKFKKRKLMRKQQDDSGKYDFTKKLKTMWEELRREDCKPEKKKVLLNKICVLLKSRVKEFAFAHDTVRIIECVLAEGSEEHRSLIFEELQGDIICLTKSTYGKFAVLKMLKYCSKKQKEKIITSFHGKVTKLMTHKEAAEVVETAFNEYANALQRFQLIQEFYGASYWHFKESNIHNLAELLKEKPDTKDSVIKSMKEQLLKVLEKTVIKHSLVHHVLLQFFLNCDPASRSEIIESLTELVPEILHTKDGSRVAMHCVWHGNHKDRKTIIKHMKSFVKKIAMEEHGHMVLLALFDSVDDTTLIDKVIIKELQESLLEISENVHGKKVLVYLLNPRDPHFFHPDIINILKTGDNNESSKKDPEKRRFELKMAISEPVTQLIVKKIVELYKNNAFCLFTATILKETVGSKTEAYAAIAKLVAEPYTSENKNVHIIETAGSYFMLKQLLMNDVNIKKNPGNRVHIKKEDPDSITFSEVLVNAAPDGVMKTWFQCNRGAFILVSLIETEIPAVVNRVKEELTGCKKQLGKFNFKGAEILLKKLKEQTNVKN